MNDEAPVQAPTDMAGVGIHLSYLRRDLAKMSQTLENITSNYVPITTFLELKADVEKLKAENDHRKEFQDTLTGKMWGIGVMAGIVVGIIQVAVQAYFK